MNWEIINKYNATIKHGLINVKYDVIKVKTW